jgi:predicted nucleotidyltransferase
MVLFPDFRDLLAAFAASGVRYVVLGGYAVIFHGRPRATKDLDLFVAIDPENRRRLADALTGFGAPPNVVNGARDLKAGEIVYFGTSPLRVDLLGSASGIEFEDVYPRAVETYLDGVLVRLIGLRDLIANKRASGRSRDVEDCAELERIAAKRGSKA